MAEVRAVSVEGPTIPGRTSRITPRVASRALYLALATMLASMVAISLFFAGAGAFWGPVNDLLVVATVLLLLPAMATLLALAQPTAGRWFAVVSTAAAIGVVVVAVGQLALVFGIITLDTSFATGGMGVLPVIAWIGASAVPSWRTPLLGRAVGRWAVAFLALIGLTVMVLLTATTDTPTLTSTLGMVLALTLSGWMLSLGRALGRVGAQEG